MIPHSFPILLISFNSLSRDHPKRAEDHVRREEGGAFNSLSRDHKGVVRAPGRAEHPFNSLSRDHSCWKSSAEAWMSFQLPLSGSPRAGERRSDNRDPLLSTPSLGITLIASASVSPSWRATALLSTPSLGITMRCIFASKSMRVESFNSLSRDHGTVLKSSGQ
jgi:hypothetical protein